jgi:formate dehydrogenase gamma subunit
MMIRRFQLSALFLLLAAGLAFGAENPNESCMQCHADASLTRTLANGAVQSLAVTTDSLTGSRHASLSCVQCHAELKGVSDFPHKESLKPVDCANCHKSPATDVAHGAHESKVKCAACHGSHHILSPSSPLSPVSAGRINQTCADCHNKQHAPTRGRTVMYANYDVGMHGSHPVASGAGGPSCTTCHGTHTISNETKLSNQLEDACLKCHPAVQAEFKQSVHADLNEGRANSHCFGCHGEHRSRAPSDTTLRVQNESSAEATCGSCHAESVARYNQSLHAYALKSGSPRAPRCESCHGAHNIRRVTDPLSPMYRSTQPETCAKCHSKIGITTDPDVRLPRSFENYQASTHGKLLAQGNTKVPVCIDCHGGHAIRPASDPNSTIAPLNIDKTCGRCHSLQDAQFRVSIHYRALKAGVEDAPTCTGCHGEHIMLSPKDPKSKVNHAQVAKETCGKCHDNPVTIRKYGLAPDVVETYRDSYHGLATLAQSHRTPSCPDCHNAHAVRTERDSLSSINSAHIVSTCAKCHPKADAAFAQSYTHRALQPREGGLTYWITRIYWVMLAVIIGGMVIHNLIILNFHMLLARKKQTEGKKVTRFDKHQLVQHMALTISFSMLVITGFALKYANAWWVKLLADVGLNESVRRILHRVMAVILIACSIYHIIYLFMTRRGREEWKAMTPNLTDVTDMTDTMKYHLKISEKPPEYGRYDYSQKAEYWALIWGTILMIATGFVLWFPAELSPLLPRWAVAASQTIHLYEAWLATLAIIVWHFFFTIAHPEEYPMSWTWLTGKINLEQVRHRHGRWYRSLVGRNGQESEIDTPSESAAADSKEKH